MFSKLDLNQNAVKTSIGIFLTHRFSSNSADMIFFDQFKVPMIKFGKSFAEFMILIALLKEFGVFSKTNIGHVQNCP